MRRRFRTSLAACCLALLCSGARAQFTLNDLQIAGRALGFLERPLSGDVKAGIVYAPDDPRSVAEADALKGLFGQGLRVGNVKLVPVLVPVAELSRSDVALFFLTTGMTDANARTVAAAAVARHTPCITTDLSQVRAGVCAMGVRAQPKIEIFVNRAAAASTNLAFSAVFRMMITET
jgi:ABC-type uncharacterized transport system substrate-binding protein